MKATIAIATLAAVLALPGALAETVSTGAVTAPFYPLLPAEAQSAEIPEFYVDEQGSVWQESNACTGLQSAAGEYDGCGSIEADTQVAALPSL